MQIKLTRPYKTWKAGDTIDLPSGLAATLIASDKAVRADAKRIAAPPRNKSVQTAEVKNDAC